MHVHLFVCAQLNFSSVVHHLPPAIWIFPHSISLMNLIPHRHTYIQVQLTIRLTKEAVITGWTVYTCVKVSTCSALLCAMSIHGGNKQIFIIYLELSLTISLSSE